MPRQLQPCGTPAAYRRHKRRGEDVDAACLQAHADKNNERNGNPPREEQEPALDDIETLTATDVVPLDDALHNLALVKAAMNRALPRELAALSKRREELVNLIAELRTEKGGASLGEQLAAARAERARRAGA